LKTEFWSKNRLSQAQLTIALPSPGGLLFDKNAAKSGGSQCVGFGPENGTRSAKNWANLLKRTRDDGSPFVSRRIMFALDMTDPCEPKAEVLHMAA
jgi:hypothetical protein